MKTVAHRQDIRAEELSYVPNRLTVHAHWMAFILLAGEGGKITFKAHYSSRDIQGLVARALNKDIDKISGDLVSDFMREYCNLTAGVIKARLADVGIHTGLSIPIVTRGFDEIWRMDRDLSHEIMSLDSWHLKWPSGGVVCTMSARADVWAAAQDLKDPATDTSSDSDMERSMSVSAKIEAIQNLHATHNIIATLEQSKVSIEQLVDEMPDALFIFDTKGTILKANLEGCRLLRVEPEDYLGTNLTKVFNPECSNILFSKIQLVCQNPKNFVRPHEFELQAMTAKEETQPYHWALRPLVPQRFDKIPLVVLYGRNLVDIRSFERELAQIYSSIPIGMLSVGTHGLIEPNYSRYCEFLLQHPQYSGLNNGFAKVPVLDLLFEPAYGSMRLAEIEASKLLVRAIGESEYWFESIRTQFPQLIRRRIGDGEMWLKVDYFAICSQGIVQKILLIIENRTDLIREREERNVWIKRNESAVRRILEIQNAETSNLQGICLDLEALIRRLDSALELNDYRAFKTAVDGVKFAADSAGFLTLKEMVEILEVKLAGDPGQELFRNRNELTKEYAQIRTESAELVRIFYTLNTEDEVTRDFQHKLDSNLYKDLTENIDRVLKHLTPDGLDEARKVLGDLRKHVLKINYLRLSTMEPFLADLAKVQSAHDRKLVKITFEWEGILVPPELAKPLRDVFAILIEKSISSGIEAPSRRKKLGKAEYGHIRIKAVGDGRGVRFHLSDDGRGVSAGKLREVIKEHEAVADDELLKMNDDQVMQLVFSSSLLERKSHPPGPIVDLAGLKHFFDCQAATGIQLSSQLGLGLSLQFRLEFETELS